MSDRIETDARIVTGGAASGDVLACGEGLSFWGGVDPDTGRIIDARHPEHGTSVAGKIVLMPTSRGSCSGSGVLLQLALSGLAPASLVFCEDEEILTLGALVAEHIFKCPLTVLQLSRQDFDALARTKTAKIEDGVLRFGETERPLRPLTSQDLELTAPDRALLDGDKGPAAQVAMEVLCRMAAANGADHLLDVTRGHIDGCILAHDANLIFAEKIADLGGQVLIPTTINAISVDRENWTTQGVETSFGAKASRLADAYVRMGARPTFTCAPYLLADSPEAGERIGWSESNAVLYANSVLGARSPKHPDYLDLFIAMTGRAPATGVYTDEGRRPDIVIDIAAPAKVEDEDFWPVLGWRVGIMAPGNIPLLKGLEHLRPGPDDLKALCAAFATTSGAPMLHIAGHTPEAHLSPKPSSTLARLTTGDLTAAWHDLNRGSPEIDLVAIGSPHASLIEIQRIADLFGDRSCAPGTKMIVTIGRDVLSLVHKDGLVERLAHKGVRLIPDLCWCSITKPIFPPDTRGIMTNSGKYAHYAHGLSGLHARLGGLRACVEAAVTGISPSGPPEWASK